MMHGAMLRAAVAAEHVAASTMDTTDLLRILGRSPAEVHAIFRCGSRVYGTATAASDEDFVAVLARRDAKQDLVFRDKVNVVVHGLDSFREAIVRPRVPRAWPLRQYMAIPPLTAAVVPVMKALSSLA